MKCGLMPGSAEVFHVLAWHKEEGFASMISVPASLCLSSLGMGISEAASQTGWQKCKVHPKLFTKWLTSSPFSLVQAFRSS